MAGLNIPFTWAAIFVSFDVLQGSILDLSSGSRISRDLWSSIPPDASGQICQKTDLGSPKEREMSEKSCWFYCSDYGISPGDCRVFPNGPYKCTGDCLQKVALCPPRPEAYCDTHDMLPSDCKVFSHGAFYCTGDFLSPIEKCPRPARCEYSCASYAMLPGDCKEFREEGTLRCTGDCLQLTDSCD
jgi:hypothetical protein